MGFFSRLLSPRSRKPVIDEATWRWVLEEHPILNGLSAEEVDSLRRLAELFLRKKQIFPLHGAEPSEELLASVAAQACLPILHLDFLLYRDWSTLYLVPDEYRYEDTEVDAAGVVHEISDTVSGQVFPLGSVALSIADVEASGWCEGYNVVIHEMAHVIDRRSGSLDGAPPLHAEMDWAEWKRVFESAFLDLQGKVAGGRRSKRSHGKSVGSRIDPYAAEAPEEFFAVTTEYFFEQPWLLRAEYPAVYDLLARYFRQDPAARLPRMPKRKRP